MSNELGGAFRTGEQTAACLISLHSCFCIPFLCSKTQVIGIGLLQTTKMVWDLPFHMCLVNTPLQGKKAGMKWPPPLVVNR